MDVVSTNEVMWILLDIVATFNLNGGVMKAVLSAHKVGNLGEGLKWFLGLKMGWHSVSALSNLPDVEVVDINDVLLVELKNFVGQFGEVDRLGGSFHDNFDTVLDNGDCCSENNEGEKVSADWIEVPQVRVNGNANSSDNDTDWHKHVSHNVEEGSIDVHVSGID
jgi:hypothetical protein